MTRVAAVDCGTNSIRLLVADVERSCGRLQDLDRRMEIVRLGQGVDRTGEFAAEALERAFAACERYAEVIAAHDVEFQRFVATSATRDASNRAEFAAGVHERLGVQPEVVSGDEEAALSFAGATTELRGSDAPSVQGPYLVVDIGGGSTELVLGGDTVREARSIDVGCVRMTERHLHSDPPTSKEVAAARDDIAVALERAGETVPFVEAGSLVGLAGSVTTVAAIALGLEHYDAAAIHHARVAADRVREVADRLVRATREERAALPVMHPGRVDVIAAGAMILTGVLDVLPGVDEVLVSEHDILDGIAWSLA